MHFNVRLDSPTPGAMVAALDREQESGSTSGQARSGGGLGSFRSLSALLVIPAQWLPACSALGPPASAAQYSCRREPCTGRSAWLPLGRACLSAWIEHRSGEQRSPYPGPQAAPARAQPVRARAQALHRSSLTTPPPSLLPPRLPLASARYLVARDHRLSALRHVHLLMNVLHRDLLVSARSLALK